MTAAAILTLLNTLTQLALQELNNGDLDKIKSVLHVLNMVHGRIIIAPNEATGESNAEGTPDNIEAAGHTPGNTGSQ